VSATEDLPPITGAEDAVAAAMRRTAEPAPAHIDFARVRSAAAVALHMHQPLIPAGGDRLETAPVVGNLAHMLANPHVGDNHDAPVFLHCYARMADCIPALLREGAAPRILLDYSGTLLHGLARMGRHDVLDGLVRLTRDPASRDAVEWLGTAWGHAVAPSTPVADFRLHVGAWQQHFAALFGLDELARVRGFSPPEMALPNHPDVAWAFVRTLREAGYAWVLVQEHTVEQAGSGAPLVERHLPCRLVCTSSRGETAEIVAVVKTQGSDTKLVGQMQPWYEARGLGRVTLAGRPVPPLVAQIADGENGGVMMNEFPPKFVAVVREASGSDVPLVTVREYLDHLWALGVRADDLPAIQPVHQHRVWTRMRPGEGPERLAAVVDELGREAGGVRLEGGSWTDDRSWVRGYDAVLGPMREASVLFHERAAATPPGERRYRNALFHLLASQTSCFRYWGEGAWTDYGRELCRRTQEILRHDFAG
jgi:hypothetical protein